MSNINNKNLIYFLFAFFFAVVSLFALMPQSTNAEICTLTNKEEYRGYCNTGFNNSNNYNNNSGYSNNYENNNSYNNYNNRINPTPYINSVSPSSVEINSNKIITVKGNGFIQGSVVKLDDNTLSTTFVDSQTLQATVTTTTGEKFITVFNSAPGGGYSNAVSIMIKNTPSTNTVNNNSSKNSTVSSKTKNTNSTGILKENTTESDNTGTDQNVKELAAGAIFGYNAFMPSSLLQWIFFAILILLAVILWRKLYVSEEDKHIPLKHA